jgi:deoxycytidylate deaminase
VGAVVTTGSGELISAGCNEVPQAGGGSVWDSIPPPLCDYRDFKIGQDPSAVMKREIIRDAFEALQGASWLSEEKQKLSLDELTEMSLDPKNPVLRDRRIANIIEYGRIVHAEMSAIMDAVRRGISVKDSTLYCTTFPCHMCARHLIAAGLKRVVYIEPYPKSMAKQLYPKSIQVDNDMEADPNAVRFEPFVGVAPRRFFELFDKVDRKDAAGYALPERPSKEPRIRNLVVEASSLEITYVNELDDPKYQLFIDPEKGAQE